MKASSLSHLTAVSGANCAVVIALVMLATGAVGFRRRTSVVASLLAAFSRAGHA
jgi:competence protein ComEC